MINWFLNLDFIYQIILAFFTGVYIDSVVWILITYNRNKRIQGFQRQLEKESISADESSAKVKVLEQKIEVLEKALENALKG